jgi:hypothetical protein
MSATAKLKSVPAIEAQMQSHSDQDRYESRKHLKFAIDSIKHGEDENAMALQAMLGSDRLHELLSYRSHTRGDQTPTVFFEKPGLSKPNVTPLPVYES